MIDGAGIPVSMVVSPANENDFRLLSQTLDTSAARYSPTHLWLDKGYDYTEVEDVLEEHDIEGPIRRRGENALLGQGAGPPRRWKAERVGAWLNQFRGVEVCWDVLPEVHMATCLLACSWIVVSRVFA